MKVLIPTVLTGDTYQTIEPTCSHLTLENQGRAVGSFLRSIVACALFAIALAVPASAQTTTYVYTGSPYTTFSVLTCPPVCQLTGSFTVSKPLAANLTNVIVQPSSFSFTDGQITITNSNASAATFVIATNGSGAITTYTLILDLGPGISAQLLAGYLEGSVSSYGGGYALTTALGSWSVGGGSTLEITTTSLPPGALNTSYGPLTLAATGGTPPYTWSVSGLPKGLTVTSSAGVISGTPTSGGSFSVNIQVKDSVGATASIVLPVNVNCTVSGLSLEPQKRPPWGTVTYDSSNLGAKPFFTIGVKGCALASISMALQADSISDDPLELNTLFNTLGGYAPQVLPSGQRTANVIWPKDVLLAEAGSTQSLAWLPLGDILGPSDAATAALNAQVCGQQPAPATQQPTPVIVGVKLDPKNNNSPGHYVVVNGQADNGDYTILDPGYGNTLLSQFGAFAVKGAIQDPSNLSFVTASGGDSVELLMTDPLGNQTGIDLATGITFNGISNSVYSAERIDTINADGSTTVDPYIFHELTAMQPIAGNYSLEIQGRYAGAFSLTIDSASSTGVVQPSLTLFGAVETGSTQTYAIPIDVTGVSVTPTPSSGTACNGVYNGTFDGDITVSSGQTCAFIGGGITGKVRVTGGSLSLSNALVRRDVQKRDDDDGGARNTSILVTGGNLSLSNAVVDGDVRVHDGGAFAIGPSTVIKGSLMAENIPSGSGMDVVCGATVHGDLFLRDNAVSIEIGSSASCPGNIIGRDLHVRHNSATTSIYNNTVTGNLHDDDNTGSTHVFTNIIKHNLQCENNTSITGGDNTAERKEGQCSAF
jgi:hypothetical protein